MTASRRSPIWNHRVFSRAESDEPGFRSYRRRFLLLIAPLAILTAGTLSLISARAVRAVATPIIRESTENFLTALSTVVESAAGDQQVMIGILESYLGSQGQCFLLLKDGQLQLEVGSSSHREQCLGDLRVILDGADSGSVIHDYGPFGTWMSVARRLKDGRILLMEKSVDGPGTLYTAAALAVTIATVLVAFLFAFVLSGILFRPVAARLERLQDALMRFEAGEQKLRLQTAAGQSNELDEVDRAFNHMAERIEELEEERRRRSEMKRALLADLAHDINTPIAVLRGFAETLVEKGAEMDEADLLSVHARILGQSYYVQAIVEDLLTMADAQGRQLKISPEEVSVDALFDDIIDAYEPLAFQAGTALIGDGHGIFVWADSLRLRQILNNLIRNALLHAKGATMIELSARRDEKGVFIRVEDDGPGIPEELVESLFERRRRGPDSASGGWGLGLAIVRTLAQGHGGSVRYVQTSSGACFEVFFPDRPTR